MNTTMTTPTSSAIPKQPPTVEAPTPIGSGVTDDETTALGVHHDRTIRAFLVEQYLPDVDPATLAAERDLLAEGIVDSLGLLKLIAWVEDTFVITVSDDDLDPDNFRSIAAIDRYVAGATAPADG